jgi:hypothetical protein
VPAGSRTPRGRSGRRHAVGPMVGVSPPLWTMRSTNTVTPSTSTVPARTPISSIKSRNWADPSRFSGLGADDDQSPDRRHDANNQERFDLHAPAGDGDTDRAHELGEDEHQQQAAQQRQDPADERPLTEVAREVVHDHAERDHPARGQRERHGRVEQELALPQHGRDPGPLPALLVCASSPHVDPAVGFSGAAARAPGRPLSKASTRPAAST